MYWWLVSLTAHGAARCTGALILHDSDAVEVVGFGAERRSAKESIERTARFLAGQHHLVHALPGLMYGPSRPASQLDDSTLGLQGYRLERTRCGSWSPAVADNAAATWTGREATRESSVVAIETARRLSCVGEYQATTQQAFDEMAHTPYEEKVDLWERRGRNAWDELWSCYSHGPSELRPAQATPKRPGQGSCHVVEWVGIGVPPAIKEWPLAVAPTVEEAVETALQLRLVARTHAGLDVAYDKARTATAETRQTHVAGGILHALTLTDGSDNIERAKVECAGGRAPDAPAQGSKTEAWALLEQAGVREDPHLALLVMPFLDDRNGHHSYLDRLGPKATVFKHFAARKTMQWRSEELEWRPVGSRWVLVPTRYTSTREP